MESSAVGDLRSALEDFSRLTEKAAESMDELKHQYQRLSDDLLSLIAGTSTGKDVEVTSAIEEAGQAVNRAQDSLGDASRVAREYGTSL